MIFTQSENDKGSKNTEQDLSSLDYYVENMERLCFILNRNGERVYSTDGKFKILHGKLYRFNYKDNICFTVKDMVCTNGVWDKGKKTSGLLQETEIRSFNWGTDDADIDYATIYENRYKILRMAFSRFSAKSEDFLAFIEKSDRWLSDYSLYTALKRHFGDIEWQSWD